jgi:hypothetical protein
MKIIGFNFTKIVIEREENSPTNININQNINIKDVKKEKIPISDSEVLKIKFNLSIVYSEGYAKLEFEGILIVLPEKEELKQFLDSWKDKKIPEAARISLFNFIMNKCNIKALYLEDELSLPLHLQNFMPRINPKQDKS